MVLTIPRRFAVLVALSIGVCIAAVVSQLLATRTALVEERKAAVVGQVQSAVSIVKGFADAVAKGALTEDEAQSRAKTVLRGIRFGKNDYIFVYQPDGVNLVLGPKPDWEGKSVINEKDANGLPLIRELIAAAAQPGGGFVSYMFARAGSTVPVAKLGYTMKADPWNWVVGTGVYVDDLDEAFYASAKVSLMWAVCRSRKGARRGTSASIGRCRWSESCSNHLGATGALITAQQQRILYSGVFLQLYNLVEATVVKCLDGVTDAALNGGRWFPGDLTEELRREWVRVIARTHVDLNPENRLESALALCQHLVGSLPIAGFKVEKGGGGNWDDEAIEQIAGRLGFNLRVSVETYSAIKRPFRDDLGPLQLIKKLRNSLAHGNISFAECGENLTVGELRDLVNRTTAYLREVVGAFRAYIDGHQFVVPERRPAATSA